MRKEYETLSPAMVNALHKMMPELSSEVTTEQVKEMLDKTEKGYTKGTITNAEIIFSYDPLLREGIRYNELTQRIDVVRDMGWERGANGPSFTDNDLFNIHLYCDRVYGFTPKTIIEESLHITAHCNAYHPIRDFLSSLEWDGTPRVRNALHHFLGADTSDSPMRS